MKYKNIEEVKIGKFSCKIGEFDKGFGFTIFAPDKTLLSRGEKKTKEEILSLYNELISKFNADREANRKSGIPTPIEFVDALSKISLSKNLQNMLNAHYNAPDRKMTSSQLAESGGYKDFTAANGQYGRLGKSICDYLEYNPPGKYQDGSPLWITAITEDNHETYQEETGHYQHILRDEFSDALKMMGLV